MRLQTKYILFITLLQLVTVVLSFYIFIDNKILFIASEVFILFSIVLSVKLYKELIQPLKTFMRGIDALQSREFNTRFLLTGKFEIDQLIGIYNQMMDQLRIERTKQEQQHFFLEKLVYTSPTGILVLDYNNMIEKANPRALDILQIEQSLIIGRNILDFNHPVLKEMAELTSGKSKTIRINGVSTYKLSMAHFIDRGFSRNFVMIEELTSEILAAEKEVYGKVIRMMAHEVNNTIGPVNSIINSALKNNSFWINEESKLQYEALQIAVQRNNNLNNFMRNFADLVKLPPPKKEQMDLSKLLGNISKLMLTKTEDKDITVIYDCHNPFMIIADEQQMEQVLINILKNAVEAIDKKGQITIKTDIHYKKLIISDTGKGILKDHHDKLFSPFFSTKKDGQGIGLMLVREILLNHKFNFSLKMISVGCTEFTIMF